MHLERLRLVCALPPDGGWRADLAVDRSTSPPRAVLVTHVPATVAGDALALSMLARGLDLSARVDHPSLRRLLGTGEVDGDLVLVEGWREGETLRALLDAGGPLSEAMAARVAIDVAGALHAGHTLPASKGRPLCHGAISAERVQLAENGEVLLCGMGRPVGEQITPEDDLRGLARLLLESLPPAHGGPGPLQAICDRVLMGKGYPTAADFAEAVAAAVTPADTAAVVARVEASQPKGAPDWEARRRALAQALRGEGGAAAEEVGRADERARVSRPKEVQAPSLQPAPPAASAAPAPPSAPPQSPQPESPPPTAPPTQAVAAPPAAAVLEQFVEVAKAEPPPGGAPTGARSTDPFEAWIHHRQTPMAVGAALGLLGLLIGFVLGGR